VKFSFTAKNARWSPGSAKRACSLTCRFSHLRVAANGHSTAPTKLT